MNIRYEIRVTSTDGSEVIKSAEVTDAPSLDVLPQVIAHLREGGAAPLVATPKGNAPDAIQAFSMWAASRRSGCYIVMASKETSADWVLLDNARAIFTAGWKLREEAK